MSRVHRLFLTGTNKLLAGLLTLLGFSVTSCEPTDEYGSPYATYEIKGKVVNEEGTAIPDIQVVISAPNVYGEEDMFAYRDTLSTDKQGQFEIQKGLEAFGEDLTFKIKAEDIDGEANGGSFEETTTEVTFKNEDLKGKSGNWNLGKAEKEVTLTMKKTSTE